MPIDVTSLYGRHADNRWDRVCAGGILERVTWSRPERVALTGWPARRPVPAEMAALRRRCGERSGLAGIFGQTEAISGGRLWLLPRH